LLLTNDGELKRKMELPSTGWLRRYRVRINGSLSEAKLDELRAGIQIEGVHYAPVEVKFDRQQGANAWLTMGLREGKNREIRKLMEAMGVVVNRLLRISYGPFQLGTLKPGKVEEVKQRIVRDQMGLRETPTPTMVGKAAEKGKRPPPKRGTAASAKRFTDPEKRNSGPVKRNSGPTSGRSAGKPPRR
jgi:23S rRNA pseudouridine2605 synthase